MINGKRSKKGGKGQKGIFFPPLGYNETVRGTDLQSQNAPSVAIQAQMMKGSPEW